MTPTDAPANTDPYDLQRFLDAHRKHYANAISELQRGRKVGHWMWFVFPQLRGLGLSSASAYYGISGAEEAAAYLAHPVLGTRLRTCCSVLLSHQNKSAREIFGTPDDLKLRSCLTLFAAVATDPAPFNAILDQYYNSTRDPRTLELLG